MKHLLLAVLAICITLIISSCFHNHTGEPLPSNTHDSEYSSYLNDYLQTTMAPGAILYISKPGEAAWLGAAGKASLETGAPMLGETQFRTGSITKVFVSALILKLTQDGKLSLSDKLSQLLPDIATHIPSSDQITVKQLLSHLSGLIDPPNRDEQYQQDIITDPDAFKALSTVQLLERYVYNKPLLFQPGTQYTYSNAGYWLLGLIAEKQGGADLQDLLVQKLIIPFQLTHTYINRSENSNVATEYAAIAPGDTLNVTAYDAAEADGKAAGGIVSTAGDIAKFYAALFSGKIISNTLLEQMETVQLGGCANADCEYGLGLEVWHVGGTTGYGHNGSLAGLEANALYFPAKQTTIILYKNFGGGSDKSFFEDILK